VSPADRSAPVVLLWGEDAFLLREAALEALAGVQPREVDGSAWEGGETSDLSTPSLFGDARALLVSNAKALPAEAIRELSSYLQAPDPDARLVLTALVGDRAKAPAALVKVVQQVGRIVEVKVQRKELPAWVLRRARAKGLDLAPDGAAALVDTFGEEPGALEQALDQLVSTFPGERVSAPAVARQFSGLGEQHIWDLCDKAFAKDLPGAMRSVRTLLEGGSAGLLVLGGIISRLRDLLRVGSLPERLPPAEAAKLAGLRFDWQVRRYREQAKRFSMQELVSLHERVAWADRALKSGATDDVVLPLVVSAIAAEPAVAAR
jgi:DNA polymerase III subunit delta